MAVHNTCACELECEAEGYALVEGGGVSLQHNVAVGRARCVDPSPSALYTVWVRMTFERHDADRGSWSEVPGTEDHVVDTIDGSGEVPCVHQCVYPVGDGSRKEQWRAVYELRRPVQLPPTHSRSFWVMAPAEGAEPGLGDC